MYSMEDQIQKNQISDTLESAYAYIKQQEFERAETELEKALGFDFENPETISALKCLHFWKDKYQRIAYIDTAFEKGEYLLKEWRNFYRFLERVKSATDQCLYSIRQAVFGAALEEFSGFHRNTDTLEPEILFRIGKCLKGLGDYQHAVEYIEKASQQKKDDAVVYAELADCYAFINEVKAAKAFFREALFLDPQAIDLQSLESLMIRRLIDEVEKNGLAGELLNEWLPVYGAIYGVFNVKRELRPLEYGKLRQTIHTLEQRISAEGPQPALVPRLINKYFWLIDHYIVVKDTKEKIEEILSRIKSLDLEIYTAYVN